MSSPELCFPVFENEFSHTYDIYSLNVQMMYMFQCSLASWRRRRIGGGREEVAKADEGVVWVFVGRFGIHTVFCQCSRTLMPASQFLKFLSESFHGLQISSPAQCVSCREFLLHEICSNLPFSLLVVAWIFTPPTATSFSLAHWHRDPLWVGFWSLKHLETGKPSKAFKTFETF